MKPLYKDWGLWVAVAITFIAATAPAWSALMLQWQDNSQVETGYLVLRQAQNEKQFGLVAELPADTTAWRDTSTRRNWTYCYMVVAVRKELNERGFSNVACKKDVGVRTASVVDLHWRRGSGQPALDLGQ